MAVKNESVLRWNQRGHCWFRGRPKGCIGVLKGHLGHSALWKEPGENPAAMLEVTLPLRVAMQLASDMCMREQSSSPGQHSFCMRPGVG